MLFEKVLPDSNNKDYFENEHAFDGKKMIFRENLSSKGGLVSA